MAVHKSPYKIALFGPTNAGKTVYLTTLYSHGGSADDSVAVHVAASDTKDDQTHDYLTAAYDLLRAGQWPDATVFEKLRSINFTVTSGGVESEVQLPDVAGEVTGRGKKIENWTEFEHKLKQEILEEFSTYDGFLIFAPVDDTVTGDSVSFKWEVDALLLALKERASTSGIIRRPVAVVLSKWDVVASKRVGDADMIEAAEEYFQREYPETASALQETCENWRVFPVSATGPTENGRPPETLRPTGVAAPIIWLLRTADLKSLERAEEYFEKHQHILFKKPDASQSYAQRALQRYEQILDKCPDVETTDRAKAGIAKLEQIIRRRKNKYRLAWVGCVAAVLVASMTILDYSAFGNAIKQLRNAKQVAEELDPAFETANRLLDSPFHPLASALGWRTSLMTLISERNSNWEADFRSELESFDYADTTRADQLVAKCSLFLERFKDSNFLQDIERIRDQAKDFSDRQKGDLVARQLMERDDDLLKIASKDISQLETWAGDAKSFLDTPGFVYAARRSEVQTALTNRMALLAELSSEKDWAALKSRYAELGESPLDQYLAVRRWLSEKGQAQAIHADEANRMMSQSLSAADSKAWLDLQEYKTKNSTNYERHIEKANEYLARVEFSEHREQVLEFRQKVLTQWDEQLYAFITEEIKSREITGDQLSKIKGRCEKYLDSDTRPVAMRTNVDAWLTWCRRLEAGVTAEVELQSVRVDRGSRWHGSFYYPDVFVTVTVNGRSASTAEKELSLGVDTAGFGKSKLGPFSWKLGDQDVVVTITCTDGTDETLTCNFSQDTFKLRHLNGTVTFDGGRISARLKCSAANPPTLPPYGATR